MELLHREIKKSVNKAKSPFLGVMCIPTVAIAAKHALFTVLIITIDNNINNNNNNSI